MKKCKNLGWEMNECLNKIEHVYALKTKKLNKIIDDVREIKNVCTTS